MSWEANLSAGSSGSERPIEHCADILLRTGGPGARDRRHYGKRMAALLRARVTASARADLRSGGQPHLHTGAAARAGCVNPSTYSLDATTAGGSNNGDESLWAYLIAAVRRQMVEALTFRLASCARNAATMAGEAGRASSCRSSHHVRKIRKSAPYALRVAAAFSALAYPRARSASATRIARSGAP
jgi:hypothetical protein